MKQILVNRKIILWAAVLMQVMICIAVFAYYKDESVLYDFRTDHLVSDNIVIDNFLESQEIGYYIDSSEESKENFVATTPVDLRFGMYKVVFHYQSGDNGNTYILTSDNMDFRELLGNYNKNLPPDKKIYTTNLWLSRNMLNFAVQFNFGGEGYFFISRVEILENRNWVIGAGGLLLLVFLCMDLLIVFRSRIKVKTGEKEWKNRVLAFSIIIIFTSLPLFNYYLFEFYGHDLGFHLMRIEGIKEGIQSGQFPVKIQPKWWNGYGYAVSIFYGDILLYFPAFLRILGLGVQTAYKCFVLFINILSAGIAYYSFKRLFHDERIGLLGCMLYNTSIYRLVCIYVRAAVGEYCAMMFLPLIITAVYEILWQEERKENLRSSWLMGVAGFSGLILTHVISTEITVVAVAVFCLVYWKRTFRKSALLQFVKMGAGILVCTLWFVVPFIDMFRGQYWFNSADASGPIQTHGVFLGQLINLFPYAQGDALSHTAIEGVGLGDELCYSIGGGLLAGVLLFIWYCTNYGQKKSRKIIFGKMLLITSIVLMIMSTIYFPWNDLEQLSGILSFMIRHIEFPWRLLGLIMLFLTTLALLTVKVFFETGGDKGKLACMIILFFAVMSSGYFVGRLTNDKQTIYVQNSDDISTYVPIGREYLPEKVSKDATFSTEQPVCSEGMLLESVERSYLRFEINCSNQTEDEGYIDLPLLYYKGYEVEASGTEGEIKVGESDSGFLRITLPGGFSGKIMIDYFEQWYWRIAEIMSLVGFVIFGMYMIYRRRQMKLSGVN